MQFKQIKNDLMEALAANKPKTAPYDTEAQVVRVEGSTAWVHIPGGVDETPVAMTINAAAGDTVRVRVGNGTAWLVGNDTAPPTDDRTAIVAAERATQAAAIARKTVELTEDLNQRIANANGLYETRITQSGATITYMHNKPNLSESDIQMMISDVGVLVTANGTAASPTWYGLTVDGNLIANILQANGINADWINTGALVIYDDNNNEIFRADKTNKILKWDMTLSSLSKLGMLTFTEDSPAASQMINHASLRVINTYYRQTLGDFATELYAANGLRTGVVSRWDSFITDGETILIPVYEQWGEYTHSGIDIIDDSGSSQYTVFKVEQKSSGANNSYVLSGSGMKLNNRSLEDWIHTAVAQISSGYDVDLITRPGTYWSPSASISSTLSHTPFTDSAFQITVKHFGNMLFQIAWQNKQNSYIKYRIYTSSNAWGSWYSLARGAGDAALQSTPTFTVTAANFSQTRARVTRSGNIVAVEVVLTAAKALSANTVYEMGRFNVNSGIVTPLYGKDGNQNVQNVYVSGTAPNYNILYVRPNVAIASGTAVEATGIFIT